MESCEAVDLITASASELPQQGARKHNIIYYELYVRSALVTSFPQTHTGLVWLPAQLPLTVPHLKCKSLELSPIQTP
jgi:hypothetical protein